MLRYYGRGQLLTEYTKKHKLFIKRLLLLTNEIIMLKDK